MADFISNLPCDLLQLILSSTPYEDAIKTSILSTRWWQIWRPVEVNLNFDSHEITSFSATQKLIQITFSFLNSSTPHALKLVLANRKIPFFIARKCVDKELNLRFFYEEMHNTRYNINFVSNPGLLSYKLKTLNLKSINCLGKMFLLELFSNCSVLETMKIEKCDGLENINIKANRFLKNLIVTDCPNIVSFIIYAPNLESFRYQGVLARIRFENTSHLAHVILDLRDGLGNVEIDCEDILDLLASLKNIETLTISGWLIEFLCRAGVIFGRLEFKLNKLKELCWTDSLINPQKRDSLICFLQVATSLEKLIVNVDQKYPSITCPIFHEYWHVPHLWMDYESVKQNSYPPTNLKFIDILGFKEEEDQLLLMDLLLYKGLALNQMRLISELNHNDSWIVSKIPKTQLGRELRCGQAKRKTVSCSTIDCFFLLTQEENCRF